MLCLGRGFGSFVLLSFCIICLHYFLSTSAAKSMHASSVSTCWSSHINSSSTPEGELLGWMTGSFSEHHSGISVSPDVGLLESSGVRKLLLKERVVTFLLQSKLIFDALLAGRLEQTLYSWQDLPTITHPVASKGFHLFHYLNCKFQLSCLQYI